MLFEDQEGAGRSRGILRSLVVRRRFRRALRRCALHLHYQPIASLEDGTLRAVEALIRWPRRGGWIPPAEFIPALGRTRHAHALHRFVLCTAIEQAREWQGIGRELQITINVAPLALTARFVDAVKRTLADNGVNGSLLHVELTELRDQTGDGARIERLRELRALGVSVSLDDFGRGESSLARLAELPLDMLKIDKIFVAEMQHNRRSAGIIQHSIRLAHALGMGTVAEGVETSEQWHRLRAWDCDYAQGFLVGPPMPAATLMESLVRGKVPAFAPLAEPEPRIERRAGPPDRRRPDRDDRRRNPGHAQS